MSTKYFIKEKSNIGKEMTFLESSATHEEDSYKYRVEWDDRVSSVSEMFNNSGKVEHYGSGLRDVSGFDSAWNLFNDYQHNSDFIGVRLIKIDADGNKSVYAS